MNSQREQVLEAAAVAREDGLVEAVNILRGPASITWDYDGDADVLYLSVGEPRSAVGVDIGDGLVLRYDEGRNEVVGLTMMGLRARLLAELADPR